MPLIARALLLMALIAGLAGCASRVDPMALTEGQTPVRLQNRLLLTPANGGQRIASTDLKPGDIILSNTNGVVSVGIRALTVSPVSHAALYLGDDQIAEAVGSGIRIRRTADFMADESTVVAFRHPGLRPEHAEAMRRFAQQHDGKKYNMVGIVLQAP
ncbi:MAG: YiiX/YebB-like N1pC/P60 family cysteine hydrolase, partial [Hydrogenophaga sp.]|uniref:YiiX/YebB-like N1pC/P60 family cysteine hydrolase n=1 Tax=Hydrogenophaga sp. TaxID=1904254 RepID=UPI003D9BA2A4